MAGISIVVATYNRCEYLKKCLSSLFRQNYDNYDNYEILVVNDSSSDNTREYLDGLKAGKLKILQNFENLGPSPARNLGAGAAQFERIAFIDDDCIAGKDWLRNLESDLNKGADFVIGQVFYVKEGYKGYFPERLVNNIGAQWPMGCNLAFRKDVFNKSGGFNRKFDKYHNEDTELALRAVSEDYKYSRALNAVVYHQAMDWTVPSLLASAHNASAWPRLKKMYPKHYLSFRPLICCGRVADPQDYLYILALPVLLPVLLFRYLLHGKRDLKIFFTKWPAYLLLKRFWIYYESVKNQELML